MAFGSIGKQSFESEDCDHEETDFYLHDSPDGAYHIQYCIECGMEWYD